MLGIVGWALPWVLLDGAGAGKRKRGQPWLGASSPCSATFQNSAPRCQEILNWILTFQGILMVYLSREEGGTYFVLHTVSLIYSPCRHLVHRPPFVWGRLVGKSRNHER